MKVVLDGQPSDFNHLSAGVPQGSILGPTLFLLFINDLPDNILNSFIDIFADDSTLHSPSLSTLKLASVTNNLSTDLSSVVERGEGWLITFKATKTKSVSFHYHRDPNLPLISMNGTGLVESNSHDRLLGLTLTSGLKWDNYIFKVAKNASKMIGSFIVPINICLLLLSYTSIKVKFLLLYGVLLPRVGWCILTFFFLS